MQSRLRYPCAPIADLMRPQKVEESPFCDRCRACRLFCPADAISDERDPEAGKDHLGHDRYRIDTARCFAYFTKHYYCSACLPVCAYEHKEWARDFEGHETRGFPEVRMREPPAPYDGVPATRRHAYPRTHRDGIVPIHALRRKKGIGA